MAPMKEGKEYTADRLYCHRMHGQIGYIVNSHLVQTGVLYNKIVWIYVQFWQDKTEVCISDLQCTEEEAITLR